MNIESMAIELPPVADHPNRAPFRGVLTLLDTPSDKPPSGARGHRVLLTRAAAEAALPSLLGMGLDYAPALDRHDARRKVGIITEAEIVSPPGAKAPGLLRRGIAGLKPCATWSEAESWLAEARVDAESGCTPALRAGSAGQRPVPTRASAGPACIAVSGYLFARDFPEIVREIGAQGRAGVSASHSCGADLGHHNISPASHVRSAHVERRAGLGGHECPPHTLSRHLTERERAGISAGCASTKFRVTAPDEKVVSLGMSYEIADARIDDLKASVWTVSEFTFTGAAVLRRDKAAYGETWIELA